MSEQQRISGTSSAVQAQIDNDVTIDLLELMYRLLAGWKMIICYAVICALLIGIYTFCFVTPMYEATAIIYVLSRRDSAINMSDLQIGTALTNDYIKVFQMWEVHEAVITNLGLPYTYREMEDMLSVVNAADTRMLDITVTCPSPTEAAAIANEYAQVASQYIADTMSTDKPNIMSVALAPSNPVSPNKTANILIGFVLGGLVAAGIITVKMVIDDTYKTAEDIRKYTGLATLAVIPMEEQTPGDKDHRKSTRRKA